MELMTKEKRDLEAKADGARQLGIVVNWLSGKLDTMTRTLYEVHEANQRFLSDFYQRQQAINRQLDELRGRSYQAYRA